MKKIHILTFVAPLAFMAIAACKKFVQVPVPGNLITTATVYADSASATAALAGLYSTMNNEGTFLSGYTTLYPGLSADELTLVHPSSSDGEFANNAITSDNATIAGMWSEAYNEIYQANAIIQGVGSSVNLSPALKNDLVGEARFCRAFIYFYLVTLYGPVPLETGTSYTVNESLPRAPADSVYQQMIADLWAAQTLLTPSYADTYRIRANQYAATALLARVYLFQGNWAGADSAASAVLSSGIYYLEPDLNNIFLAASNEAIWQMQTNSTYFNSSEAVLFLPYYSFLPPSYKLQSFLLNAFDPNDLRYSNWTKAYGSNIVPYKYKIRSSATLVEYEVPLRLAEQYLIRAEARVEEGTNIPGALADVDTVRSRAGLQALTYTTNTALLDSIYHEDQIEFFAEWGHRWLDLIRTGLANNVLGSEKSGWAPQDTLYPIPVSQLLANPNLTQNGGY